MTNIGFCIIIKSMLLSAEQRSFNRDGEHAIELLRSGLELPSVRQALGQIALPLVDIAERLYVPNIRRGVLHLPREQRDGSGVAIVARPRTLGLRVSRDFSISSPRQYDATERQLIDYGSTALEAAALRDEIIRQTRKRARSSDIPPLQSDGTTARVWSTGLMIRPSRSNLPISDPEVLTLSQAGRPIMVLDSIRAASLPVVVHEAIHVRQIEDSPLTPYYSPLALHRHVTGELAMELEAYEGGARCVRALQQDNPDIALTDTDRNQLRINNLRARLCAPDDPYNRLGRRTDAIRVALADFPSIVA